VGANHAVYVVLAVLSVGLIVVGFTAAVLALKRLPEGPALIKRLFLGTGWPSEAPLTAAYLVAAGMLLGLIAAIGLIWLWVTSPGGSSEPSEQPPARQTIISR
jgi:protein-S-isoprenylcysteine O-methyltransferase Ste14